MKGDPHPPPVIDPCNLYNPVVGLRQNVQNSISSEVVRFAHIFV